MATLFELQEGLVRASESGNEEHAAVFSDAIREHPTYQKQGQEALSKGFKALEGDERKQAIHKSTAQAMGIKPSELDSERGMGLWGRTKLSFQPTEQDKFKQLEDTYGKENLRGVDIGGSTQFLYRDEDETGGKWRRVDEQGASLADFTADIAGEALPTAGAVVGGVAGSVLSPVLGTAAGSAAGYATAAGLQDVAVRALSGEDIRPGEIAKRTAIETAIMAPIDLATAGLAKGISGKIGRSVADELTTNLAKAETVLSKSEALQASGIKLSPDMRVSQGAVESASEIAGSRKGSKIAERYARLRDNIATFKEAATTGVSDTGQSFGKTAQRLAGQYKTLIDDVAKIDKEAAGELQNSLSKRMQRMAARDEVNMDKLGQRWVKLFETAEGNVARQSSDNFKEIGRMAADRGVSVTNREAARVLDGALSKFKVKGNPEVDKIVARLKDAPDEVMDFQTLRETIEVVQDAVPSAGAVGGKTSQQVASVSAEALRVLRKRVAKRGGEDFAKAYDNANKFYTDKVLSYKRGPAGKALAERFGGETSTPTQVMNDILSDPAKMRQALDSIDPADEVGRSTALGELQQAFLSKHGMFGESNLAKGVNLSSADRNVARELWGKRKLDAFDRLNKQVKQLNGADMSKVTTDEIDELFSAYSTDAKDAVARKIARRTKLEAKAERMRSNALLKKIIKDGGYGELDVHLFADDLLRGSPEQVKKVMGMLKGEEANAVKQEFVSQLFAKFQTGAQLSSDGLGIWNPQAMQRALSGKEGATMLKNMKAVLGEKSAKEIIAANDVLAAASALGKRTAPDIKPRFIFSPTTIAGYFVGDVMGGIRHRIMGWAYGTESLMPLMRLMSKKVSQEQFEKNFSKIIAPMLASEKGLLAAAREGDADPSFQESVSEELSRGAEPTQ